MQVLLAAWLAAVVALGAPAPAVGGRTVMGGHPRRCARSAPGGRVRPSGSSGGRAPHLVGPRGRGRGRLVQVLHDHVTLQSLELSDANILVWVEGAKGVRIGGDRRTQGVRNNVVGNTLSDNAGYGLKVLRRPQGRIAANTFARNRRGRTNQRP